MPRLKHALTNSIKISNAFQILSYVAQAADRELEIVELPEGTEAGEKKEVS